MHFAICANGLKSEFSFLMQKWVATVRKRKRTGNDHALEVAAASDIDPDVNHSPHLVQGAEVPVTEAANTESIREGPDQDLVVDHVNDTRIAGGHLAVGHVIGRVEDRRAADPGIVLVGDRQGVGLERGPVDIDDHAQGAHQEGINFV